MNDNIQNSLANLADDEISTPVMAYSSSGLSWGQLITKKSLLPERILTGATVPDFITLNNAQTIVAEGNSLSKPNKYSELHVPYDDIIGFHLMPPREAQLDYDTSEPNRIMAPVTVQVGTFHFNSSFRISTQTTIQTMLGVTKSDFISVYDVDIHHPGNPNMKAIHVNFAQVRRMSVLFGASS
jgi:hypothetical protein